MKNSILLTRTAYLKKEIFRRDYLSLFALTNAATGANRAEESYNSDDDPDVRDNELYSLVSKISSFCKTTELLIRY
jgi:hypothetical protein